MELTKRGKALTTLLGTAVAGLLVDSLLFPSGPGDTAQAADTASLAPKGAAKAQPEAARVPTLAERLNALPRPEPSAQPGDAFGLPQAWADAAKVTAYKPDPDTKQAKPAAEPAGPFAGHTLTTIFTGKNSKGEDISFALIDGQKYQAGDSLEQFTVQAVEKNRVVFVAPGGKQLEMRQPERAGSSGAARIGPAQASATSQK